MNGLVNFISDMRAAKVRELEWANINNRLDQTLNGYNRKKYIAKLMYLYILGYEIDFGFSEAVNLMSSVKYSEKHIGYLAVTLMIQEDHELYMVVVQAIKRDLEDHDETFNCLALHAVANIGGRELYYSLVSVIFKKFTDGFRNDFVKKKAGLCLLRIYRKNPDLIPIKDWAPGIIKMMDDENLGVVNSAVCLVTAIAQSHPELTNTCVTKAITRLHSIVVHGDFDQSYSYYKVPAPWLQVKLLRLLQYFPPPQSPQVVSALDKYIQFQLKNGGTTHKNYNQGNVVNAILFELINYMIHLDPLSPSIKLAGEILASFLASKETNYRYLALDTMAHLAVIGDPQKIISPHQQFIVRQLHYKDISIRRRALDLLYSLCNEDNFRMVISELQDFSSDESIESDFRHDLVLKIAILAEKFVNEYTWYVDVILKLVATSGMSANDSLRHRVVQIITNHEDLREYAAYTILQAVKTPSCQEVTLCLAAHILGEFGHVIVESPGCAPLDQFLALHSKFSLFGTSTKAILLSTYFKFVNLFPEIQGELIRVLGAHQSVVDVELQQRACEYLAIINIADLLPVICEEMPPFPEKESTLLAELTEKLHDTQDNRTWTIGGLSGQKDLVNEPHHSSKKDHIPANATSITSWFQNLALSSSGLLYEDSSIQIGVKSEYNNHLGQLSIFFGNKNSTPISNLIAVISSTNDLHVEVLEEVAAVIPESAQLKMMVRVEAINIPLEPPTLHVSFRLATIPISVKLRLPVIVTKFISCIELEASEFLSRWHQIGDSKELVRSFAPALGINVDAARKIATGLNFAFLPGIDPNPDNLVMAGIFSANGIGKVGCLFRLESIKDNMTYRIFIRATNESVATAVADTFTSFLTEVQGVQFSDSPSISN